jgi:MFS family permease
VSNDRRPLLRYPGFVRFWVADAVSMVGSAVTGVALGILASKTLGASDFEIGLLNSARWLPYPILGLIAGVYIDRHRRQPVLVGTDLGRGLVLGLIPIAAAFDVLTLPLLIAIIFVFGTLSIVHDAAHHSFPPSLVPVPLLTSAYARLEQSAAVAGTGGPMVAGLLVKLIGAPLAILVDAVSYLASGLLLMTVRPLTPEVALSNDQPRNLKREVREGLSWVYRHRGLAPLTLTSHLWWLFQAMFLAIYVNYGLKTLQLDDFQYGLTFAFAGVGSVVGATASGMFGRRFGVGPGIIICRWLCPVAYLFIPLAGDGTAGLVLLCLGMGLFGVSLGLDGPIEMGYRQSVTPSELLGRMNATMRSVNRGVIVIGAPLGGLVAGLIGRRPALWIVVAGMVLQAVVLQFSKFRHARLTD